MNGAITYITAAQAMPTLERHGLTIARLRLDASQCFHYGSINANAMFGYIGSEGYVCRDCQAVTDDPGNCSLTPDEFNLMVETWAQTERNTSEKRPCGIAPHEMQAHKKLRQTI